VTVTANADYLKLMNADKTKVFIKPIVNIHTVANQDNVTIDNKYTLNGSMMIVMTQIRLIMKRQTSNLLKRTKMIREMILMAKKLSLGQS